MIHQDENGNWVTTVKATPAEQVAQGSKHPLESIGPWKLRYRGWTIHQKAKLARKGNEVIEQQTLIRCMAEINRREGL